MLLTQCTFEGGGCSIRTRFLGQDGVWQTLQIDPRRPPHRAYPKPAVCGDGAHKSPSNPAENSGRLSVC